MPSIPVESFNGTFDGKFEDRAATFNREELYVAESVTEDLFYVSLGRALDEDLHVAYVRKSDLRALAEHILKVTEEK